MQGPESERRSPLSRGPVSLGTISTARAERVISQVRYRYGLGQAYQVSVRRLSEGQWEMKDGLGGREVVRPMSERRLRQWFWDRYGDVIAERQQTSEG